MKVLLLTSDYNISANVGIRAFLESPAVQGGDITVTGILVGSQFSFSSGSLQRTVRYFKKMHIPFLLKNILTNIWKQVKIVLGRFFVRSNRRKYYGIKEMADFYGIPYTETKSINSQEAVDFIKTNQPDILASCFLLEIVRKNILDLPPKGSINIHPSLFQRHRGTFSSFWAILQNWKTSGATVHYMTENIDDGDIILQKRFFVHPSDTMHSVNEKAAVLGGKLLAKALMVIKKNQVRSLRLKKLGKLFSFPNPQEIKSFYAKGKILISRKELFKF